MTEPFYADDLVTVLHGDCLDVLAELPDASVDAVVTDPPYLLGFMGREWDTKSAHEHLAFHAAWAAECLRVLKPGGHLLAFGGTRTYHRLTCAIEDAGFEIRDSIVTWLYGSGFPKSLDVSKAIDKTRDDKGEVRAVCRWLRSRIEEHAEETVRTLAVRFGFHPRMVEHWAARETDSQPTLPTLAQWDRLREVLGFGDEMDAEVLRLNLRKGEPGEAWADRPVTGIVEEWKDRTSYAMTSRDGLRRDIPATDAARQWQGFGTALKPAFEPIVMARKPLCGTVAANVTTHGTGALNIDGCRVMHANASDLAASMAKNPGRADVVTSGVYGKARPQQSVNTAGRWPSNVLFTHSPNCADECSPGCPVAELDAQSGITKSTASSRGERHGAIYGNGKGPTGPDTVRGHADSGGAARFFPVFRYQAKAPTRERPKVNGVAHPCVKPLSLMRWLVRLVTPPGGIVLDPFLGSGTTAQAARDEGFRCIGIERDAEYLDLIRARLDAA